MRNLGAALAGVLAMVPCWSVAQDHPSTEQIIEALRPSAAKPRVPLRQLGDEAAMRRSLGAPPMPGTSYALQPSVQLMVHFATNSTELTLDTMAALDALGRALQSRVLSADKFRIEGHTDTVGTREYNRLLSELRAIRVVDYLTSRFRVDRGRMVPVGMGQDQLLVRTGGNQAEPRNRRVTVTNLTAQWDGT